jgi:hypothetical protein
MVSGKVNIILGVHYHLPNGVPEEEFQALYNYKIRPLVSALHQFPRINMVFHFSGVILHWIERHHPELFVLLEDILSRKQAELLGGGFYEPIMPLLPQTDKIVQIEMLTTYLRRQFGKRPQGCWLPAFLWEQNLVGPLKACGMNYTFLDESYFQAAGQQGNWHEPCITEDQGKIITVFPVSSSLREENLLAMTEKILGSKGADDPCECLVTVFPNFRVHENPSGEKAEAEYLLLFQELSSVDERIEFTTPSRSYRNLRGLQKRYFTCCAESLESSPRQFLTDYPEAGLIYAKMIHTRVLINQLRGDKARKHSALEELLKAQDSSLFCPAGLCNVPVRKAAYRALLEAEKITRDKGSFSPSLSAFDYDLDGEDEYVFKDEKLSCYIKTKGAFLFELDYFPRAWNYLDTFIPGGKICGSAFTDHLVPGETLPQIGWQGIPEARFCGDETFQVVEIDRIQRKVCFRLPPKDAFLLGNIAMKKTWHLKRNIMALQYELENQGSDQEHFYLVPMVDLSFAGGTEAFTKFLAIRASKESISFDNQELLLNDLSGIECRDIKKEVILTLESNRHFDARLFSVESENAKSLSEYQFTCVMPLLQISLKRGKNWMIDFSLKISS